MPLLAVLQQDDRTKARIRSALSDLHELEFRATWGELWETLHTRRVAGCVVDIYDASRPVPVRELLRLRRREPPVAIIVYSDFTDREMDLFDLGRHKIDGVILAGAGDTPRVVRETVLHALGRAIASRVEWVLAGRLPPPGVEALRWSVENAERAPGVKELAEALGRSSRSLARELRRRDLPSARRLLLWGRLFRAAYMLETADRTVESVAFALGYASGTGLARAFRRETGHPPTEVMRRGGVAWVLEAFHRTRTGPAAHRIRRKSLPPWAGRG